MKYKVEFTSRAIRDLNGLSSVFRQRILEECLILESAPFPVKKKIRRIQGIKFPCFRLRIDTESTSFRVFFGIDQHVVFVLHIVQKKDADRTIRSLQRFDFPPN